MYKHPMTEEMVKIFSKVIRQRAEEKKKGIISDKTDLLQSFIDMRHRDGTGLTDDQVSGKNVVVEGCFVLPYFFPKWDPFCVVRTMS